jgi:hypothetical protein
MNRGANMSNENAGRPGRTNGAAPMGSTVAIVVTLIALVLGFLILRKVNDNSSSPSNTTSGGNSTSTSIDPGSSTTAGSTIPTSTTIPLVVTGTQLQVANASNQDGVARAMSTVLQGEGFTMAEPVSATEKLETSKVLYDASNAAAQALAESLAAYLGIEAVAQGLPVPVESGSWAEGSGAIFMVGNDFAGKTLDEILGVPTTGTTTPPTT